jgi:hypothetical protein
MGGDLVAPKQIADRIEKGQGNGKSCAKEGRERERERMERF